MLKLVIALHCASSRIPSVITGKLGHIRRAYKGKEKTHHNPKKLGMFSMYKEEQVEGDREYSLFSIPYHGMSKPYTVMLIVAGQQLQMEIDTGASLSLISESICKNYGLRRDYYQQLQSLKPILVKRCQFGYLNVQVSHNSRFAYHKL